MGLRFRKSIKILPGVKLNIGKKGASVSTGVRGLRYTVGSSGRRTRTVGIPGTGLSYVSTSSGKSKKSKGKSKKSKGKSKNTKSERSGFSVKKFLIAGLLFLVFIAFVVDACNGDEYETTTVIAETTVVSTTIEETTEETTTEEPTTEETTTEEPTTKETTTEKPTTKKAGRTVYVTPNGERYHFEESCAGENAIEKDINEVGNRTPCQKCAQ